MTTNRAGTEQAFLDSSRQAIENGDSHPEISTRLENYFYDKPAIEVGRKLYQKAADGVANRYTEQQESNSEHDLYIKEFDELLDIYKLDKRKAKLVFKRDDDIKVQLMLTGRFPTTFVERIKVISTFYKKISENEEWLTKLARVRLGAEEINFGLKKIKKVIETRDSYTKEKGEAQVATKEKDAALTKLDIWMDDYLDIAEIALIDQPQLLEIMGIIVK